MQDPLDFFQAVIRIVLELWPLLLVYVLWRLHVRLRDVEATVRGEQLPHRR